jgi:nucleoporin POM152
MNPDGLPFCLDNSQPSVKIPIRFNQTMPSYVELLRFDFDTNTNETIVLSSKERKGIFEDKERTTALAHYTVKKPGVYRLHKVIDESKLEVQRRMSDTLVVRCPKVEVTATGSDKCVGDLSDLTMEIEGTPPLKIVYTRTANADESTHRFQSIQPENFASPLLGSSRTSTLVVAGSQDFSWARSHRIKVPLNESMTPSGKWMYSIDEIHDATGNIANFSARGEDGEHLHLKGRHLEQIFEVHERPLATLSGHGSPLMIATGKTGELPIEYVYPGRVPDRASHTLTWKFSPLDTLTASGDHGNAAVTEEYFAKNAHDKPVIGRPGLYTLTSVKSQYCEGEVKEPASCLLLNPPEPQLSISAEKINDSCAGSSVGLLVDLDLIGTPPFVVRYDIITKAGTRSKVVDVTGLRHQLELKPKEAGHFKYRFTSIDDAVYKGQQLRSKDLTLEQDVKPPASAWLTSSNHIDTCIEEPVEMNVQMTGEPPFTLEYELVHDGKRKRQKVEGIESHNFKIKTDPLLSGGEYSLALATVQDTVGCKIFLNDGIKFNVRHQRPKASFGHLDGKHKITDIADKEIGLPLRLTGQGPWTVKYTNLNDTSGKIIEKQLRSSNDFIKVVRDGVYKLLEVSDNQCPGTIDSLASTFEVEWLPRPYIKFADTAIVIPEGNKFVKREVCEGDIDAVEVNLIGKQLHMPK